MEQTAFKEWAIVELFGHSSLAGMVTSQMIGTCSLIRIDVPEIEGQPGFTKMYGEKAVYSITPTDEETAKRYLKNIRPVPVNLFCLRDSSTKQLPLQQHENLPDENDYADEMNGRF